MRCTFRKFHLIHSLFHSFVRKNVFYSENIKYVCNFYGTDLYPPECNVCKDVFRTQSNIYDGVSLRKSQKSFIVDLDWVLNTSLI